jgi:hypothetical protein
MIMKKCFLLMLCAVLVISAFAGCEEAEESKADISKNESQVVSADVSEEMSETVKEVSEEPDFVIVDYRNTQSLWDTAIDTFYRDDTYEYFFGALPMVDYVKVEYSDGTSQNIREALKDGKITIADLDEFGIIYFKEVHEDAKWDFMKHRNVYVGGHEFETGDKTFEHYDPQVPFMFEHFPPDEIKILFHLEISVFDGKSTGTDADEFIPLTNEQKVGFEEWCMAQGLPFVSATPKADSPRAKDTAVYHGNFSEKDLKEIIKMAKEARFHIYVWSYGKDKCNSYVCETDLYFNECDFCKK